MIAKYATAFTTYVSLKDAADLKKFKANPTIAAGDVKVTKDGGSYADITTLPSASPASSINIKVDLSATEMTASVIAVDFVDAAGAEWADLKLVIHTTAQTLDDLPDAADINAEVKDVLETDTHSEIASVPASVTSLSSMIRYLFTKHRNKTEQTAGTQTLYADNGSTTIGTATVTDDGTTATKGKMS